jgi:hypothetical protein
VRRLTAMAVLLAAVATALVAVREQAENRRMERRVWDGMRRRDGLLHQRRELEARIAEALSAVRLLDEYDRRLGRVDAADEGGEGER